MSRRYQKEWSDTTHLGSRSLPSRGIVRFSQTDGHHAIDLKSTKAHLQGARLLE